MGTGIAAQGLRQPALPRGLPRTRGTWVLGFLPPPPPAVFVPWYLTLPTETSICELGFSSRGLARVTGTGHRACSSICRRDRAPPPPPHPPQLKSLKFSRSFCNAQSASLQGSLRPLSSDFGEPACPGLVQSLDFSFPFYLFFSFIHSLFNC